MTRIKPIANNSQTSQRISDLAAHIAEGYPESAENLHRSLDSRTNDTTIGSPARREAAIYCKECERYRERVRELRELVIDHLPNLGIQLHWIMRRMDWWHNDARFDWKPVIEELRTIEITARQLIVSPVAHITSRMISRWPIQYPSRLR